MAAAIAAGVLSILVAGYLTWVTNEYMLSRRSQSWTQALHLCEAGVELGLAELNFPYRNNAPQAFSNPSGWQPVPSQPGSYYRTALNYTDAAGFVAGSFTVTVANVSQKWPTITCMASANGPKSSPPVSRGLKVVVNRRLRLTYALMTRRTMDLQTTTGSIIIDSFDSSSPLYSTGGQYDPAKRRANGNIASLTNSATAINLKNTHVYGYSSTGLGGHVAFSGASVGGTITAAQRSWTEADGETKGWITHDAVMSTPSVVVPSDLASSPNLGDIMGSYTFSTGDYRVGKLKNTSGDVIIDGIVRIYATGDIALSGSGKLTIRPGGSLEVYAAKGVSVAGNGVENLGGLAENSMWWGLPTSTDWKVGGSGDFIGVVYAPQADFLFNGNPLYIGAFLANSISAGGNAVVHYDEALSTGVSLLSYTVQSWQPLVNSNGVWVLETK